MPTPGPYTPEDQEEARRELEAREARWLRSLGWCRCLRPVRDRAYVWRWSCRRCGRLVRWLRVERRGG